MLSYHSFLFPAGRETSKILGRLSSGIPIVPPLKANPEFIQSRNALPVMAMKDLIMDTINKNQVTIICGETGSGKTTQVSESDSSSLTFSSP